MRKLLDSLKLPLLALVLALLLGSIIFLLVGESPLILFQALYNSLFTPFGLGYSLFYATPLILTGLSVALSFRVGLFNIGAEGQLYVGAIAIVSFATLFPGLSLPVAWVFSILIGAAAGGLWGGIAGILKAKRGSHEVIVTILLNFIAVAIVDYLILFLYKNPESQNPETIAVPPNYYMPKLFELFQIEAMKSTPVNLVLLLAILLAIAVWFFLDRSILGYELRATGENPDAASFAGISTPKNTMLALFLSGAISGLVGVNEVNGYEHRVIQSFSPQYGFTGIAVALLARNHPIGIIFSAVLFGTLQNSSREIEFLSNKVTKELSMVLQAILLALVASSYLLNKLRGKRD